MSLLEVKNLTVEFKRPGFFGIRSRRQPVLKNISFSLEKGDALGVIGESSSGKTTLARCIAGLLQPASGTIQFQNQNIFPESKNRKFLGSKIQLVFQSFSASLDPQLTVQRIILEGVHNKKENGLAASSDQIATELCALVGLPPAILYSYPFQLSGGERQRVALARAIAVEPSLLILDEPTSALDVITQGRILTLIKTIMTKYEIGIIFISHNIANSMFLCNRTAVLHEGSIVEIDATELIRAHPSHPYTKHLLQSSGVLGGGL